MQLTNPAPGTTDGATPVDTESSETSRDGEVGGNRLVQSWTKHVADTWMKRVANNPTISSVIVFAVIVAVELLVFGASIKKTGFYLDDWLMLKQLSFGPQNYFSLIFNYLTTDPRVIIRPIEALHFGTVFFFSGTDPVGWRVSNMVMEVVSTFFVYLIVARLATSRLLGFFASMFFLAYPVHDSTHYWAVCSCVSLALTCYLASLWSTIKATSATANKRVWLAVSYLWFALSIYGYEPFLPLCALNAALYAMLTGGFKPFMPAARKFVMHMIPFALIIGSLLLYQRTIVPMVLKAALHKIHLEPALIATTIFDGLQITSPVSMVPFVSSHINSFIQSGDLNGGAIVRLVAVSVLLIAGVLSTADVHGITKKASYILISLGILTAAASYSIFGLNPEYKPTLITLVNRINTGGAFGLSIALAGLIGLLFAKKGEQGTSSSSPSSSKQALKQAVVTAVFTLGFAACTVTNWSLGKPWEISWSVQERTFDGLRAKRDELASARSIVLMNCPRYVDATPVFDGPWDFEQQLHLALRRTDIAGGVVSERLILGNDCMQDVTLGFACAEYPYKDLVLVTPGLSSVVPVSSASQFIDVVQREGRQFGLSDSAIEDWKSQVKNGTRRKKNGVLAPIAAGAQR